MSLATKLKELRTERNWTQLELSRRSGLDRGYIANLEGSKSIQRPSADAFLKLAYAFNIKPEELYHAAGYIDEPQRIYPRLETPDEILERLKNAQPIAIPIYTDFLHHAGNSIVPIDYIYRARHRTNNKNHLEGYRVHGNYLEPEIDDGDIIIIDRNGEANNGDIVVCLINNQLCIAQLRKIADELWLENNFGKIKFEDCQIVVPVIEVRRGLK